MGIVKKSKKGVWNFLNYFGLGGAIQLHLFSGLKDQGWFLSFHHKQPINLAGEPIPWFTYPAIQFLTPRVKADFKVFEFGSGYSTLWFAQRVKSLKAVEGDQTWMNFLQPKLPQHIELVYQAVQDGEDGAYAQEVKKSGEKYDLIIVDGLDRNNCVKNSLDACSTQGVIILDNSERDIYEPGKKLLTEAGFKVIDFWGMTPVVSDGSCTSFYYRPHNCLDI